MSVVNRQMSSEGLNLAQGSNARIFVQLNGTPLDKAQFFGRVTITNELGVERDEPDVIEVPSDSVRGQWVKLAQIDKSLQADSFEFEQMVDISLSDLWDDIHKNNLRFTLYVLMGNKVDHPSNFNNYTGVLVLQNCSLTSVKRGASFNPMSGDDNENIVLTGSATYWDIETFRTITTTDISGSTVTRNILDAVVDETTDLRNNEIFAITANASTSAPSAMVYYKDNGTLTQTNITALSTDGSVNALGLMGDYVVLLRSTSSSESHLWSTKSNVRSATTAFTAVTSGYVSSKGATDIYVLDSANAWLCGLGGYIYKMTSPLSAVTVADAGGVSTQNLSAIDGFGQQIIAVGASSAIVVSNDFGVTWQSASAPTSGLTLTDVSMVGKDTWYLSATNGNVYYTDDGGVSYSTLVLPVALTSVTDIEFIKNPAGYSPFGFIGGNDGSASYLLRTKDGGNTWENGIPAIKGFATAMSGVGALTVVHAKHPHLLVVGGSTNLVIGKAN